MHMYVRMYCVYANMYVCTYVPMHVCLENTWLMAISGKPPLLQLSRVYINREERVDFVLEKW